jgi:hypothetical protein
MDTIGEELFGGFENLIDPVQNVLDSNLKRKLSLTALDCNVEKLPRAEINAPLVELPAKYEVCHFIFI